jgi:hypothetical protein
VYEVRPLGCSSFPLLFDAGDWETYGHYPCLKGRQIDPEDLKMGERIRQIMREESKTDLEVFWNERRNVIGFKNTSDFFVLAEKVLEFQRKADPEGMDPRTRRFGGAVIRMRNMIRTGRINDGITSDMFAYLASSVMFPTYGEAITERFEQLSGRIPGLYDDTSERYKKILEELAEKDS